MRIQRASIVAAASLLLAAGLPACEGAQRSPYGSDADADADGDADTDADTDADADSDGDTEYTGPVIPETCAQAEQATTTVGCHF